MAANPKVLLMLDLQNKLSIGLNQAKTHLDNKVTGMKSSIDNLKTHHIKAFSAMKDEIPGIGTAVSMLTNPYLLAAGGLALIGKGLMDATNKAAEFNTQFRQLQNINLDKSRSELKSLKDQVLNTAYDKGFDPFKTSTAMFDVQSLTGKYGGEAAKVVAKQGEFAQVMQADFNEYISGSAKAMANFGFGVDKLDDFNRSMFATVGIAKTTYEELSKVSAMYAGSAAASKQSFDTANKLFGLFTSKTKSVDEAATLTKSFFNDLTKAETIKSFKSVGIDIFDSNKNLKQADKLMLELNKKFMGLDDKQITNLKNKFAGSEGLIGFVQTATDQTGKLKATFDSFDNAKFKFNEAFDMAKNDVNYINEQLKNKLSVSMIKLGEDFLPILIKITSMMDNLVNKFNYIANGGFRLKLFGFNLIDVKGEGNLKNSYNEGQTKTLDNFSNFKNNYANMNKVQFEAEQAKVVTEYQKLNTYMRTTEIKDDLVKQFRQGELDGLKELADKMPGLWSTATKSGTDIQLTEEEKKKKKKNADDFSNSVDQVTGSAKQIKNLTVNIESFHKGNTSVDPGKGNAQSASQYEEWFTDMCMRVVRSLETTY